MKIKIKLQNFNVEGQTQFLLTISPQATLKDLEKSIRQELNLQDGHIQIRQNNFILLGSVDLNQLSEADFEVSYDQSQSKDAQFLHVVSKFVKLRDEFHNITSERNLQPVINPSIEQEAQQIFIPKISKQQETPKIQTQNPSKQQNSKQQIEESSESESPPPQKKQFIQKQTTVQTKTTPKQQIQKIKQNITAPVKKIQSSSESSESESEELQLIQKKPVQTLQKAQKIVTVHNNQGKKLNLNILSPEEEFKKKQSEWPNFQKKFTPALEQQIFQKSAVVPSISQKNNIQLKPEQQQQVVQPKPQASSILQQWIRIKPDSLKNDISLIQDGDQIQFKHTYLDLIAFEPKISDLKKGKVIENLNGFIKINLPEVGEVLNISYTEFSELSVNATKFSPERISSLEKFSEESQTTTILPVQSEPKPQQEQKKSKFLQTHDDSFKQIGKQVNFYYTDKNYSKDDFLLQHSSQNEQKYMPLKLILNFPKIKKVLDSEQKLKEILDEFITQNKPQEINFELGVIEDVNVIRKKQDQK